MDNTTKAFFELVRAGLWEKDASLSAFGEVDYGEVMRLAEEQSVVGLVTAGFERVKDVSIPKEVILQFIGSTLQIEQRNKDMDVFVADLVNRMRTADIYTFLIKGQGIAQCYERPLWRASGDVDFFLSDSNYFKAKDYLTPLAVSSRVEGDFGMHQEMIIKQWVVELHGDLRNGLSHKIDGMLDEVQRNVFYGGNVRSWINGNTTVFLPCSDDDIIIVFTHIIKHLFKGGIGLRQICDWCRLLYTYKYSLNHGLLESRIRKMGLMSEWKAFGAFAVEYLGMPTEAMPMYDSSVKWKRRVDTIIRFVVETGNFGHNRDVSYQYKYSGIVRKIITFGNQIKDNVRLSIVFPCDSFRFLISFTARKTAKLIRCS